jgi:hypothetical protein
MPEQSYPPYVASAISLPRQLNRWLDVNPQNGPLRRTQTYIALPAFSIPVTWAGFSDVIGQNDYQAPNNLSLAQWQSALPSNPNYLLCIRYINSDRSVVRYKLWSGVGEVMAEVPLYTGQLIKKNFTLEIWSTNSTPAVQATDITFFTSVLGSLDYRYGFDSELAPPFILCEDQDIVIPSQVLAPDVTPSSTYWFTSSAGITLSGSDVTQWEDQVSGKKLTVYGGYPLPTYHAINPPYVAFLGHEVLYKTGPLGNIGVIYLSFLAPVGGDDTNRIFYAPGLSTVVTLNKTLSRDLLLQINGATAVLPYSNYYGPTVVEIIFNTSSWTAKTINSSGMEQAATTLAVATYVNNLTSLFIGDNTGNVGTGFDMLDILTYPPNSIYNRVTTLSYLLGRNYYPLVDPLTVGLCAQPTLNI